MRPKCWRLVSGPDYKPITLKAMSRRFKVGVEDYAAFRATVKGLVKQGRLDLGKDKSLSKPHEKGALLGVFRRTSKGFGFVRPLPNSSWTDQIYIPIDAGRDASSGDEVLVKIVKRPKGPGRNAEGRVVRVVARATGQFVGTYFERGGRGIRPGRRHGHPRPGRRRRPRRQGGQARRQGRAGDGPLSRPPTSTARG